MADPFSPMIRRLCRLALRLAGAAFACLFSAAVALAQSVDESDAADPPGRVGSVTLLAGPVTMVDLATGSREEALLNWPVTGGWRIETGAEARAEVRIGSTALRLDDQTTVDFARLDDQFIQIAVLRGSVSLRLRSREVLDELEVLTQRERIAFDEVGRYRIDVDRRAGLTEVTAFFGRARIGINRSTFTVGSGQRGELAASPLTSFEITAAVADGFDEWVAAREAREESVRSAAYVSRETTGVESLDQYGDWRTVEDYGPVWFPRAVAATWAPYRFGRWIWVSPWGWTWVDEAPWGFAPLHYGRWAVVGGAWGWVPGVVVVRPVFAPALVAWFGTPGIGVTVGAPVGWFPLGPREVYVPAHRHSPRYLRVINVQHVPNVAQVTIVQTPRYVHRHPDRSTWVPGDRFGRPEPVHRGQRPPPSEWRQYIARPQPPANVPNTKRRQAAEGAAQPAPQVVPRSVPSLQPPGAVVRPPAPLPRAVEAPQPPERARVLEAPRPGEAPHAVQPPRAVPAAPRQQLRQEGTQGGDGRPATGGEARRMAPRTPAQATELPSSPYAPPVVRTPPRQAVPQPPPQSPVVPRSSPRQREVAPVATPRQIDAPKPRQVDVPPPRGRAEAATPREGYRQSPHGGPSEPVIAAPVPVAPAQAAPSAARPSPSPRANEGEHRGNDRSGIDRQISR